MHTVCIRASEEFLAFSASVGNDLSTPHPEYGFDGLVAGDQWCLCASRWQEAFEAGVAPPVILASTHASTLEWVELSDLAPVSYTHLPVLLGSGESGNRLVECMGMGRHVETLAGEPPAPTRTALLLSLIHI